MRATIACFFVSLLFLAPVCVLAQEPGPELKPGQVHIVITDGPTSKEHYVVLRMINIDGVEITRYLQIPRTSKVLPNGIICSIDKLSMVMKGLEDQYISEATTTDPRPPSEQPRERVPSFAANNSKVAEVAQLEPITTPKLQSRTRARVRPSEAVSTFTSNPQEVTETPLPASEEVAAATNPSPEGANPPEESTAEPAAEPTPAPADTTADADTDGNEPQERIEAMLIIAIVLLSLVLLSVFGLGFLIVRTLHKMNIHMTNTQLELNEGLKLKQTHESIHERIERFEEAVLSRLHLTHHKPTAEPSPQSSGTTSQVNVPTLQMPGVDPITQQMPVAPTGPIGVPNPTGPIGVVPPPAQPATAIATTFDPDELADQDYLRAELSELFIRKPELKLYCKEIDFEAGTGCTKGDVQELIGALENPAVKNSVPFTGLKQWVIGHEVSTFIVGDYNECLLSKTGTTADGYLRSLKERLQMAFPVAGEGARDLDAAMKAAGHHAFSQK